MFANIFEKSESQIETLTLALIALSSRDDSSEEDDPINLAFNKVLELYKLHEPEKVYGLFYIKSVLFRCP